jgi:hypothetical protein
MPCRTKLRQSFSHGPDHCLCGEHRLLRVLLVRHGSAKERHQAVAQELVHCALVAVDLVQRQREESIQGSMYRIGAEPLGD